MLRLRRPAASGPCGPTGQKIPTRALESGLEHRKFPRRETRFERSRGKLPLPRDHAGTAIDEDGRLVTAGGRVLSVTAVGDDLAEARARAYEAVDLIRIRGAHHRSDIAMAASLSR